MPYGIMYKRTPRQGMRRMHALRVLKTVGYLCVQYCFNECMPWVFIRVAFCTNVCSDSLWFVCGMYAVRKKNAPAGYACANGILEYLYAIAMILCYIACQNWSCDKTAQARAIIIYYRPKV